MATISVLMPVYNCERHIEKSIESLINQTYDDFELNVYDDGSNRETKEILRRYQEQDERVNVIFNDERRNIVVALNTLIELSRGEYIARMDADDVALPERLEAQLSCYPEDRNDVAITCACEYIDESDEPRGVYSPPTNLIDYHLKYRNPFIHPTLFTKTGLLRKYKYREVSYAEDYDLYCRMAADGVEFIGIGKPLLRYRVYEDNVFNAEKAFNQNISSLWIRTQLKQGKAVGDIDELSELTKEFDFSDFADRWKIYASKLSIDNRVVQLLSILKDYSKYDKLTKTIVKNSMEYRLRNLYMRFLAI